MFCHVTSSARLYHWPCGILMQEYLCLMSLSADAEERVNWVRNLQSCHVNYTHYLRNLSCLAAHLSLIKAPHERWPSGKKCWEIDEQYWPCSGIDIKELLALFVCH